ncbi:MAG: Zinc ABC transporter, substrate-binding protein ZnuA [uncultured Solirubrobacteraceae bacterium]|uniref:Zinc ABC transporter, substrate-binding protein ZnuA n=1 Tax=uncultured Solirubrobacteraceae bacterium TaxID=1162706 RepID=A0A6J4U099_9ACTN|nr:MAG: Zinc ABC transporter, substrate-binding protein ZnuA [uncultured Solirubrobacteraceae bacterium]
MTCVLRRSLLLLALGAVLAGCGEEGAASPGGGRIEVVATTTHLADIARNVAGDRAEVRGLLAANADPHEHEVRPSDVDALTDAAVVLRSGGDLDDWLAEAVQSAGSDARVTTVADSIGAEGDDPHWWQDPRNGAAAAAAIRDALTQADPEGAAAYRANSAAYVRKVQALDRAVAACMREVPAEQRKLVTTHDALGFYAERYGIEVVGAVIPSLSTRGQPSAGETAELVETIRRERVAAIFAESAVEPKVEEAIARESGAQVGRALYADTLGPAGSDGATYLGSIRANTLALVEGFSDGAASCSLPPA